MVKFAAKLIVTGFSALLVLSAPAMAQEMSPTIQSAYEFAEKKKFQVALAILSQASSGEQQSFDHQFAKARILTWARNYNEAERVYENLLDMKPNHPDLMVSYAYMQLFSGNLLSAEAYFSEVLKMQPDYEDARKGSVAYIKPQETSSCPYGFEEVSKGVCASKL